MIWTLDCIIVLEKLVLDPFLKNQNWVYLLLNSLKFHSLFLLYVQVEDYPTILKLLTTWFYFIESCFKKQREVGGMELVSLDHFLRDFWRKTWHILFYWLAKFECLFAIIFLVYDI